MAKAPPTLLIDGDILLYEVTAGNEVEADFGDDIWGSSTDVKVCKVALSDRIEHLKKEFKTPNIVFCISDAGTNNFRLKVLPSYKSKRKNTRKPWGYKALKDWVKTEYPYAMWPGVEADDVCGVLATTPSDTEYIVVSEDKDLKTIPCTLYRKGELHTYTEDEANYWFLYQTLCGDVTDGYKGCPGIGDKTADKLLKSCVSNGLLQLDRAWETVVAAFAKQGLTEDDALAQARCARILRATEWDQEKKQVKLWEAPRVTKEDL